MILMRIAEAGMPELYKRRDRADELMEIDPDKLTPAQLDQIAEHLIKKALGDNPEAVAEAKWRLEAGEMVTVEAIAEHMMDAPAAPNSEAPAQ